MMVLADYLNNLEEGEKQITSSEDSYKFTFNYLRDIEELNITVKIEDAGEDTRAVRFAKNAGSKMEFLELYEKLIADLPDLADSMIHN